jgi:hypothetical protein
MYRLWVVATQLFQRNYTRGKLMLVWVLLALQRKLELEPRSSQRRKTMSIELATVSFPDNPDPE